MMLNIFPKAKFIIFVAIAVTVEFSNAQTGSVSPYTIFGVGKIENGGFVKNQSLGGSGIGLQSRGFINPLNPASLNSIDSLSMLWDLGARGGGNTLSQGEKRDNFSNGGLNNIALAFRVNRWWGSAMGINSFSKVNYKMSSTIYLQGGVKGYIQEIEGSGGINRVFWNNSFSIMKNLSFGIGSSYLFGNIKQNEITPIPTGGSLKTDYANYMKAFLLEYGIQYTIPKNDYVLTLGATYNNRVNFSTSRLITVGTDAIPQEEYEESVGDYKLPMKTGVGFSLLTSTGLSMAGDYLYNNWASIEQSNGLADLTDSHRFSLGFEFFNVKSRKINRWKYQLGGYYENTYLNILGQNIIDKGITGGFSFPIKKDRSHINVAFNYGQQGTSTGSHITDNYYGLSISLSMYEVWFRKMQFD